jgi:four helix bundle protein
MNENAKNDLVERTTEFGLRIVRMFVALPKTDEARVMGKQVLRFGTSVGANYREAQRARSTAEFIAKIGDCLKELDEPSGARQTMRQHCPQGERGGAHQTNQLLAILTTISKNAKR